MGKETTKNALLEAGKQVFLERGYNHSGIEAILQTAGVPKGSFYYYFESKEHLYEGVVQQMFEAMTEALRGALETSDGPGERLLSFLEANFKVLAGRPAYARLLEQEMDIIKIFLDNLKPDTAPRFVQRIAPLLAELRALLEEGVKSGVFRPIDIDAVLPLLLMLVRTSVRGIPLAGKFISAARKVSPKRRRAAAIDFITCALFTASAQGRTYLKSG